MNSNAPVLETRALRAGYGRTPVVSDVTLDIRPGEVLCMLGPNGGGKTTLFKTLLGLLPALGGEIHLLGQSISRWSRNTFARHVGYVPQAHDSIFPFTVLEVVLMGRAAWMGRFSTPSPQDHRVAQRCLESLGIAWMAQHIYTAISGGERQLVLIARALAQEPALLIMDEPTASLDFGNQIRVLEQIASLRNQGIAILMSTHQPEHALRCADRVALLANGRISAIGPVKETATAQNLANLYGVSESIISANIL